MDPFSREPASAGFHIGGLNLEIPAPGHSLQRGLGVPIIPGWFGGEEGLAATFERGGSFSFAAMLQGSLWASLRLSHALSP